MKSKYQRRPICIFLAIICLLVFWNCYPKPIGPVGPDKRQLTWDQMNMDQRSVYMKSTILPRATELFRNWQPKKFETVSCNLCHNLSTTTEDFHMPTNHLPRLSGDWTLAPEREKYPETTKLKLDHLVPLMSESLGKKPFSIITRRGFGCYSCHLGPSGPMFGH